MSHYPIDSAPARRDIAFVHPPDLSREIYLEVLSTAEYRLAALDTPEEGLAWLDAGHRPSLVVVDLLPRQDSAWALIDRLRQDMPEIPVVILTSLIRPDGRYRRRARGCGVAAFVAKPCSLGQLADIIRRVLAGERQIESVRYTETV